MKLRMKVLTPKGETSFVVVISSQLYVCKRLSTLQLCGFGIEATPLSVLPSILAILGLYFKKGSITVGQLYSLVSLPFV